MLQAYTVGAEVKSRIDIFVKDMGIVTAAGRSSHVPLPLAAATQQLFWIAETAVWAATTIPASSLCCLPAPKNRPQHRPDDGLLFVGWPSARRSLDATLLLDATREYVVHEQHRLSGLTAANAAQLTRVCCCQPSSSMPMRIVSPLAR
jgi:hypothetical protein